MLKIVMDTNVLVSALVFGGKPRSVLETAIEGRAKLILSEVLLEELTGILEGPKFRYPRKVTQTIRDLLISIAEVVTPSVEIDRIVRDPDDNRILECAVEGCADFIISGDLDLLELGEFRGIRIRPPARFVRELEKP